MGPQAIGGESAHSSSQGEAPLPLQHHASPQLEMPDSCKAQPPKSQSRATDTFKDKYLYIISHNENNEVSFEMEQGDKGNLVKGSIKKHYAFWQKYCSNEFILDTVNNGYKIPFHSLPKQDHSGNNRSAAEHTQFVSESIIKLLEEGRIQECSSKPTVVNPLSVSVQPSGKKRLILDLRKVNLHIWKEKVKYEDLKTALLYLKKGKFMFSFDLKSGYHQIDIHPEQTQYLGFSWKFGNIIRYFKFLVLPFGLSSAPYIFTKIMRVMVKKWRSEGKEIILYLDDGLGIGNSLSETNVHAKAIHKDLIEAGFILNDEKSKWQPQQTCQWLGFLLDTKEGVIAPVNSKINRIKEETTKAIDSQRMHVKAVASIVGQIISMTPALGNITRLMTRSMLADVQASPSWNKLITISKESKRELEFWSKCISRLKRVKMKNEKARIRLKSLDNTRDWKSLEYG